MRTADEETDGIMPRRRTIAVVTGTRAEYGILRTVMRAIDAHPRLRLQLLVTGMHLLPKFGRTIREIRRDGWNIDATVRMHSAEDSPLEQALGLGRGIAGLSRALDRLGSEVVLVLGDRVEAFAGAAAAVTSRRVLAHVHGGDVATGDIDDSLRHSITKLAHVHFPATPDAAARIRRLGEPGWRIHQVGAPGLDELRELLSQEAPGFNVLQYAPAADFALVARHPCGRSAAAEQRLAAQTLRAVAEEGLAAVVCYPNSAPGFGGIVRAIESAARRANVRAYRSLPRTVYLQLLRAAKMLVGNSSSGIIESAFLGTPSVNVGDRQAGRLPAAPCVLNAPDNRAAIRRAIRRARSLRPRPGARTAYGNGTAGARIACCLARLPLDRRLRSKKISH